jgi:hypothetical protein
MRGQIVRQFVRLALREPGGHRGGVGAGGDIDASAARLDPIAVLRQE